MQDTDPHPQASTDHIASWLRLEQASGVGCLAANRLLDVFGSPQAIFSTGPAALAEHLPADKARALAAPPPPQWRELLDATLAWLGDPAHHVITRDDPRYPALLAQIPDPPLILYAHGDPALLARPAVAIVGSRNASLQGKANADNFAQALSDAGLTVVSGLALGIDAAAHEGALRGAGATIAVVGTGLDQTYPARNRDLARRIAAHGCIVSEYALGTPPVAANFPRRNRIISGLCAGVLVVEAAAASGSLITAHTALDQNRDVFAIPGSIHSALAKGCHKLIREGAMLVETVDDVLDAMRLSPLAAPPRAAAEVAHGHGAMLEAIGLEPVGFDVLACRLKLDTGYLNSQLLLLEMAGLVERLPGGAVQRVVR